MTERGQVGETKRLNILYSVALHINRVQIIQSLEKVRTDLRKTVLFKTMAWICGVRWKAPRSMVSIAASDISNRIRFGMCMKALLGMTEIGVSPMPSSQLCDVTEHLWSP